MYDVHCMGLGLDLDLGLGLDVSYLVVAFLRCSMVKAPDMSPNWAEYRDRSHLRASGQGRPRFWFTASLKLGAFWMESPCERLKAVSCF